MYPSITFHAVWKEILNSGLRIVDAYIPRVIRIEFLEQTIEVLNGWQVDDEDGGRRDSSAAGAVHVVQAGQNPGDVVQCNRSITATAQELMSTKVEGVVSVVAYDARFEQLVTRRHVRKPRCCRTPLLRCDWMGQGLCSLNRPQFWIGGEVRAAMVKAKNVLSLRRGPLNSELFPADSFSKFLFLPVNSLQSVHVSSRDHSVLLALLHDNCAGMSLFTVRNIAERNCTINLDAYPQCLVAA